MPNPTEKAIADREKLTRQHIKAAGTTRTALTVKAEAKAKPKTDGAEGS